MSNKTVYELIFTAKNATSGTTREVASEVAAVKDIAAQAAGAAAQMQSAYSRAFEGIGEDLQNGTLNVKKQISIQKKVIEELRRTYQQTKSRYDSAPTNYSKSRYGDQLAALKSEIAGEQQALTALEQAQNRYGGSAASVRTQLLNLRNEMAQMRIEGKAGNQEYEEKRRKMEQLGTVYRELQTEQQALSTGATQWGGAISGLQGIIGLYSAGSGVVSLFVKDNEKLQAIQTKLQATMSIMMGMQQVANTLHATSAFRIVTVRKATELWRSAQNMMTGSLAAGSVAAKVFWGSVSLGATVVIGAAISAVSRWMGKHRAMREQAAAGAKAIAEANEAARKSAAASVASQLVEYRKLQSAWSTLGNDMTAKARFVRDNKTEFDKLGVSVKGVRDAENLLVTNQDAFLQTLQVRAMALAAMELAATKSKAAIEKLLQAESPEITADDRENATNAASVAYEDALRNAGGPVGRGAVSGQQTAIKQAAYNDYIRKLRQQRTKELSDAAKKDMDEVSKLFSVIRKNNGQVAQIMSGAGFTETPKSGRRSAASSDPKSDVDKFALQLARDREDSERAVMAEGWQKKIADTNAAHERWLIDTRAAYEKNLKIARQNGMDTASLTEKFNALVLAKDAELIDKRAGILKEYSQEVISEYIRQTGDVTSGTQAAAAKLTARKIQPVKIPEAAKASLDSEVVASLRLRLEGIEQAKAQIESLRSMLGMGNLTKRETAEVQGAIDQWSDYAESLGFVNKVQRGTGRQTDQVAQAVGALGNVVGSASGVVDDGAAGWLNWGASVISSIATAIPQIMALTAASTAQANANAASAVTGAAASVASIPIVGWILAGAAVAGVIAAMASVPKFADGGIAYGPTLGLFGEYSGAQNNPEVVAPLDKLQAMLQPAGFGGGVVRFEIDGRKLVGVIEKEYKYNRRTR